MDADLAMLARYNYLKTMGHAMKKPRTLQIVVKPEFLDAAGEALKLDLKDIGINAEKVRSVRKITFDAALSSEDSKKLQAELTDPVTKFSEINRRINPDQSSTSAKNLFRRMIGRRDDYDFVVEVSKKPGVTDSEGR